MLILVGHEASQEVTKALRDLGHEAFSCDQIDCYGGKPEWHLKMDVMEAIKLKPWDMAIFFPDCTFICVSGLHWNDRGAMVNGVPRAQKTEEALQHVCDLMNCGIPKISIENPIGCISTRIFRHVDGLYKVYPGKKTRGTIKPTQIIQPYNFGEDASKATCLWLFDLPPLINTGYYPPRIVEWPKGSGKMVKRWGNQTDSGQNNLPPSEDFAKLRSKTYTGVARAMATQWTGFSFSVQQLRIAV